MKRMMKTIAMGMVMTVAVTQVNAQTLSFKANTGDKELDLTLSDMNTSAKVDLSAFKKDLSVSFNITDAKLDQLMVKMQPAEVYYALEIAKITSKTIDEVAKSYEANKAKGWGVIAKEMGIKPGSKEFHALKNKAKGKNDKVKGNKNKDKGEKGNGKSDKSGGNGNGNGKGKGKK